MIVLLSRIVINRASIDNYVSAEIIKYRWDVILFKPQSTKSLAQITRNECHHIQFFLLNIRHKMDVKTVK
ncbi:hypothetical protein Hanom_Chr14g01296281 [Helianthus anomalus]